MGKLWGYLKSSFARTFTSLGGYTLLLVGIAIPIVGFALHFALSGIDPMIAELEVWLIYTIAATVLVFATLFLWNLICAPYRHVKNDFEKFKESVKHIESDLVGLEDFVSRRDTFTLRESGLLLAGQPLTLGEPTGMAAGYVETIRQEMLAGFISTGYDKSKMQMYKQFAKFDSRLAGKLEDIAPLSGRLDKQDLGRVAKKMCVLIPGLTGEDQKPRSLPSTATKKQP